MKYMRILFTDIAVMHSGLTELGPGFVVCHDFGKLGDVEQTTRIAKFISPNEQVANMTADALLATVVEHSHNQATEHSQFENADAVIKRLQQKLDALETAACDK